MSLPATVKKSFWVEKRNELNERQYNGMTLQELRFLSIYLSRINARDPNTRRVRFNVDDFQGLLGLGRVHCDYVKDITNSLLHKIAVIETYGQTAADRTDKMDKTDKTDKNTDRKLINLFSECRIITDSPDAENYVELVANQDAIPLMFEFKSHYFKYELWNILRLASPHQIRMYEILKQYEFTGCRIITMERLRDLLGVGEREQNRYTNFRTWILESCRQALERYTDIKFTYEPYGKLGPHGKIQQLRFTIMPNTGYEPAMTLEEFIGSRCGGNEEEDILRHFVIPRREFLDFWYVMGIEALAVACRGHFNYVQICEIQQMILKYFYPVKTVDQRHADYVEKKYKDVMGSPDPKHPFAYVKFLIELDMLRDWGEKGLRDLHYVPKDSALLAHRKRQREWE